MFVAAVFDIVSESTTVKTAAAKVNVTTSLVGTSPVMPSANDERETARRRE